MKLFFSGSNSGSDHSSRQHSTSDEPYLLARASSRDESLDHFALSSARQPSPPRGGMKAQADVHNPIYLPSIDDIRICQKGRSCSLSEGEDRIQLEDSSTTSFGRHSQYLEPPTSFSSKPGVEVRTVPAIHYSTLATREDEEDYVQVRVSLLDVK